VPIEPSLLPVRKLREPVSLRYSPSGSPLSPGWLRRGQFRADRRAVGWPRPRVPSWDRLRCADPQRAAHSVSPVL